VSEALFINVEVSPEVASDPEIARKLEEVCPVDIFQVADGRLEIVEENLDECVLCQLCLNAAPAGSVRVIKLYDNGALLGIPGS
jgi:NAD-dependent dihydropyrimidine dehydrogenase PreA subunit